MVLHKRWENAWQARLLKSSRDHNTDEHIPSDPQTRLMQRVVHAAKVYKQKQQYYLKYQAAASKSDAAKSLAERAYNEARVAQRNLFTEIMRLEALESKPPSDDQP